MGGDAGLAMRTAPRLRSPGLQPQRFEHVGERRFRHDGRGAVRDENVAAHGGGIVRPARHGEHGPPGVERGVSRRERAAGHARFADGHARREPSDDTAPREEHPGQGRPVPRLAGGERPAGVYDLLEERGVGSPYSMWNASALCACSSTSAPSRVIPASSLGMASPSPRVIG